MSDTQTVGTSLTVDLEQFDNWLNGVLIDNNMVVREAECIAANNASTRRNGVASERFKVDRDID